MEKLRTLTLALAALATLSVLATATTLQQESRPTTVKSAKSNGSERVAADNASAKLLKGKVTGVDNQAKTFTVAVTFSAAKLSKLPTVGQIVDITYTETPGGGPLEASNLNLSKSNIN